MLDDLAEELEAACTDGSLPRSLSPEQAWIQPDGRVQLCAVDGASDHDQENDQKRALRYLAEVAVLAMEGREREISTGDRVRAPMPEYASHLMNRLLDQEYQTVHEFRQEMESVQERPAAITRWRRAKHLGLMLGLMNLLAGAPTLFIVMPVVVLREISRGKQTFEDTAFIYMFLLVCCAVWTGCAALFRGGLSFWLAGIVLRRGDGRKAGRLQSGVRTLLVWGPPAALSLLAVVLADNAPDFIGLSFGLWGIGAAFLVLHFVLALVLPRQSIHDRIVGTYLVPR